MTHRVEPIPKRTRESASKVRTGCSVCKIRRVKCDEGKPNCRRCTIGGRNCEYNNARTLPTRNLITIYLPPVQSQPTLFISDRGHALFSRQVAEKLDGEFDSSFWTRLVLQLSSSEPSVRHAVSCLGVMHQDVESSLQHPTRYVNISPEAQKEWSKAVKSLMSRMRSHPNSYLIPLVCCLLFTCIEFLQDNTESSMLHIHSGFNILTALRRGTDEDGTSALESSSAELKAIENQIIPLFTRLNVLCSLAGKRTPLVQFPTNSMILPPRDLTESRRQLYEISDSCLRFIGDASLKTPNFQIDFNDLVEQTRLKTKLETWYEHLKELLPRMEAAGNPAKNSAVNLLLVQYKVIYIWVRVCTTAAETATDSYLSEFEELLDYAKQIIPPGLEGVTPTPLSFDIHILAPLYYTALKCRHPVLRRRALEMLRRAPQQEALWNARHAYVSAKRVIELEEEQLGQQGLPVETARLHHLPMGVIPSDHHLFEDGLAPGSTYPATLRVVFQTKPWGLNRDWHTVTEYIKL